MNRRYLEVEIEQKFTKMIKQHGGLCEKFNSTGRTGVPDRIVTLPNNTIIFVEFKMQGKKPNVKQLRDHARRRELGCTVLVIDSLEQIEAFKCNYMTIK